MCCFVDIECALQTVKCACLLVQGVCSNKTTFLHLAWERKKEKICMLFLYLMHSFVLLHFTLCSGHY